MSKLNMKLLSEIKQAFVQMPPESGPGPVAGGGMMTQAQAAPMDPAMAGGMPPVDPAMAGGAPMDPAMAGGMPPVDPAMAGGMPPVDPAMAGMPPMDPAMLEQLAAEGGGAAPAGQIVLSPAEFIDIIKSLLGGKSEGASGAGVNGEGKPKSGKANLEAKIDQLLSVIGRPGQGGMPPQGM